jgi:outer membrane murein-binding lipoprotein Lpp
MKSAIVLKVAAAAVVVGLVGCTDLKPLQAEVADLKSQVGKLQSDVSAAKQSADQANSAAQSAKPGCQRRAEHGEPGIGCRAGEPVLLRCYEREDRPDVQAIGLEVKSEALC